MEVLRNGKFSLPIKKLNKGLRKTENSKINSHMLTSCSGVFSKDGMLTTLDDLVRIDDSDVLLSESFPYPQLFVETNFIIICGETTIYEYASSTLTSKITVSAGSTWSLVSFHDYIYLSNGNVNVVRDAETAEYSLNTTLPTAMAICNYNGQVIVGSPNSSYI